MSHWLTQSDGTLFLCISVWRGDAPADSHPCYFEPSKHLRNSFSRNMDERLLALCNINITCHALLQLFKEKFFISESRWEQFPNISETVGKVSLYEPIHLYNFAPKGNLETYPSSEASCIMQDPTCFPFLKEDIHLARRGSSCFLVGLGFLLHNPNCPKTFKHYQNNLKPRWKGSEVIYFK